MMHRFMIYNLILSVIWGLPLNADTLEPKPIHPQGKIVLLDGIAAVVIGELATEIITHSDTLRPSLNGAQQTVDDLVRESLVFQDAQKLGMVPSDEDVDTYLKNINVPHEQLKLIFQSGGYTFDEGREQLKRLQACQAVTQARAIGQNFIIPDKDILAYYRENPEHIEATYTIQRLLVPFEADRTKQAHQLSKTKSFKKDVWSKPFSIKESELAENRLFIKEMTPGTISEPLITNQGFELLQLISKEMPRKKSLEEQKVSIIETLQKPYFERALSDYYQTLEAQSSILNFQ